MEDINKHLSFGKDSSEPLPSLIKRISSQELDCFDTVNRDIAFDTHLVIPSLSETKIDAVKVQSSGVESHKRKHSVSISMPLSPMEVHLEEKKRVIFRDDCETISRSGVSRPPLPPLPTKIPHPKHPKFHSQPLPKGSAINDAVACGKLPARPVLSLKNPVGRNLRDKRYNSFKTWSGKLERQLSHLRGRVKETETDLPQTTEMENVPVHRYFDALEGPELDTLKPSEELLLPEDKLWPFLLRYPISSFGLCLGLSSQAIMWKNLATSTSMEFLHVSLKVNLILWILSIALFCIVAPIYILKIVFYFEAVRREYYHPIRVNFFFAPWIALLFLALGVPPSVTKELHAALWYVLMTPILILELKIYGQWMSGGQRRLSKVANPSNHLSVVGNFVGALLGASMGLKEGPIFFFAIGLAHYTVLFVTLYQRLPTNETLPKELHPVFFLFVAAPSVASMAWAKIQGSFDFGSRIAYFVALFLYFSLAVRVNFFRGFRFSLAWWAYTFPMTGAAIATLRYSIEVPTVATKSLSIILCTISTTTVTALLGTTIFHAFVRRDLFPNDIAIAINGKRPKTVRKWYHRRNGSSDNKEHYLKVTDSNGKDVEASVKSSSPNTSEENTPVTPF
ncbi:S-type anion channel SLAH3 [Heracleum sosnowskyi]|uniref:S-type anion channel SLAH3 n=1 Tax=Heracleum sosnowskyi TaxID=360622 RepID=A0AAD8M8X2_9APIA|nr:S-type anion channel SLAH3 [Heracleum sosnowskyi]